MQKRGRQGGSIQPRKRKNAKTWMARALPSPTENQKYENLHSKAVKSIHTNLNNWFRTHFIT